jgi:pyruvate/2-oxoglutarate dehydrogenase complex dihydrolipoamide acyltransferase (E2) component
VARTVVLAEEMERAAEDLPAAAQAAEGEARAKLVLGWRERALDERRLWLRTCARSPRSLAERAEPDPQFLGVLSGATSRQAAIVSYSICMGTFAVLTPETDSLGQWDHTRRGSCAQDSLAPAAQAASHKPPRPAAIRRCCERALGGDPPSKARAAARAGSGAEQQPLPHALDLRARAVRHRAERGGVRASRGVLSRGIGGTRRKAETDAVASTRCHAARARRGALHPP